MLARILRWLSGRRPEAVTAVEAVTVPDAEPTVQVVEALLEQARSDIIAPIGDGGRHRMLSARLAAVSKLNARAGRSARRKTNAGRRGTNVPKARLAGAARKVDSGHRSPAGPSQHTAQIIPFPVARKAIQGRGLRKAA